MCVLFVKFYAISFCNLYTFYFKRIKFSLVSIEYRTRIRMIRQYSRMLNMEDSRLTKRIMLWDRRLNSSGTVSSWSNEIKLILDQCNLSSAYSSNHSFHLKTVIESISNKFKQDQCNFLRTECAKMPKLRTFMLFKEFGATAPHLTKPSNFFSRKH